MLTFLFMGFKLFEGSDYKIPKDEQIVNDLLNNAACLFKKKYKLLPIGTSVAMPSGVIKKLGLEFQLYGPESKEEIRKILINCSQELLNIINSNLEIRPYLECYPFTIDRIGIGLFINHKDNSGVDYPHIGIATIRKSKLEFLRLITTDIPNLKDTYVESYEDALKALEQ